MLRDLFSNAERADKKARLRSLKDLDRSAATLATACKVVLDSSISDDNVRARLFNDLPRVTLEKALEEAEKALQEQLPKILEEIRREGKKENKGED